ncbi:MAG: hypothetical protein Q4E46_03775 [Candidatus Saccharibacteria bacterium]|nr:hypothetical protein [Candidatus Saccharibacteria bacterium]
MKTLFKRHYFITTIFCSVLLCAILATQTHAATCNGVETAIVNCADDGKAGSGIYAILRIVLNILTMGIGILGTAGLIVAGAQYMSAKGDPSLIVKAKTRILNIVIGLIGYSVMYGLLLWIIPGGITFAELPDVPSSQTSTVQASESASPANSTTPSSSQSNNDDETSQNQPSAKAWDRACGPEEADSPGTVGMASDGLTKKYTTTSGRVYYNFYQDDSRWANNRGRGSGSTIGDCGCAVTSMAAIVTSYSENVVTPATAGYGCDFGPNIMVRNQAADYLNADSYDAGDYYNASKIVETLQNGGVVMVHVKAFWTSSSHYMPLVDYRVNNGVEQVYIANTLSTYNSSQTGWVNLDVIKNQGNADKMWIFTPKKVEAKNCL